MRIGKIASSVEYRTDGKFQNWKFLKPNVCFANLKKFLEYVNFIICTIPEIFYLEHFKNF